MNNPAAFPRPFSGTTQYAQDGMTLRDYFAAKAAQGMFASGNIPKSVRDDELAAAAYGFADAMMEARNAAQD